MKSSQNLLRSLTPTDADRLPRTSALELDDLGSKRLESSSSSSSFDLNRYPIPGAYHDTLVGSTSTSDDFKAVFSAWASKLRFKSETKDSTLQKVQLGSVSQVTLPFRQDDPTLRPEPLVPRKPVRRSSSYERDDDKILTATTSDVEKREMSSQDNAFSKESYRIPFTNKTYNHVSQTSDPSKAMPHQKDIGIAIPAENVHHRALWNYQADDERKLGFEENEVFIVSEKLENGWWFGTNLSNGESGWIPSPYFDSRPLIGTSNPSPGSLLRRQRAVRQKKSVRRAAAAPPPVEPGEGEMMHLYQRFSSMLLSYRECAVCGESKPYADFPDPTPLQCQHLWNTCNECVRSWIAAELDSKGWDHINCPEPECRAFLNHSDVSRLADSTTFERYDALAFRAHLSREPNFRWCLSTTCQSGQIHDDASGPIFKCIECGAQFCTHHEMPWHRGETCRQYDQRVNREKHRREERASEKILSKTTKKCPGKGCGWMIEKNKGCDHMTCRQCKHEFCWICLAPYDPIRRHGNGRHKKNCKHHSDNVR